MEIIKNSYHKYNFIRRRSTRYFLWNEQEIYTKVINLAGNGISKDIIINHLVLDGYGLFYIVM